MVRAALAVAVIVAASSSFAAPDDDKTKLKGFIRQALDQVVPDANKQNNVMGTVNAVIADHLKGLSGQALHDEIHRMVATQEGQRQFMQEVGLKLGASRHQIETAAANVTPQTDTKEGGTGTDPQDIPGTEARPPIEGSESYRLAVQLWLTVHGLQQADMKRQHDEEERRRQQQQQAQNPPSSSPSNAPVQPPPVDNRSHTRHETDVAQGIADSKPRDSGWQGNATRLSGWTGDYEGSTRYLGRYMNDGGGDSKVLDDGGQSAYATGNTDLARKAGQLAAASDPDDKTAQALANLSQGHLDGVNVDGAIMKAGGGALNAGAINAEGDAKMAASAIPDGGGVAAGSNFFGAGSARGGNPRTAAEIAAAAQRELSTPPTKIQQSAALTREAASAMKVADFQKAFTIATEAIDLNPRNAQAWNYRAIADNKLARYQDAVYDASFSLTLVPGNAPALQTRSWAFAKQKEYKEALADANFTIEKEPSNAFAFQNRAYAQAGLGDRQGALDSLRRSAELDPRFKDKYDAALQAPENSDLLFLFNEEPASRGAPASAPGAKNRFLRLVVLSLFGGLIVALGVLNIVSERWREKMRHTIRKVIGSPAPIAEGPATNGQFWGGQYEMVRNIGSGGMGVVYEATDKSLDRKVAVKKMRDEVRMDPAERQRFIQEARTVASLHHPNIVDIFAIVEDDQDVYLVFEYVNGKTLSEILRDRGTFDLAQARRILSGACAAVEHAHKNKIIHRDIKPSNIMISEDGAVKVMDFGVARQAKDAMTRQALTNTIVGTPPYMAPEQEQGSVRKESDVFGLAAVFYEMLTGRLPFQGQGAGMLLNKINNKHIPASSVVPSLPPGLDGVIAQALAADPEKRYQSPAEFLDAVDAFVASGAA